MRKCLQEQSSVYFFNDSIWFANGETARELPSELDFTKIISPTFDRFSRGFDAKNQLWEHLPHLGAGISSLYVRSSYDQVQEKPILPRVSAR